MTAYEVTVKVLVHGPPNYVRAVEKLVHSLVQEELPGADEGEGVLRIVGASVDEGITKVFNNVKEE